MRVVPDDEVEEYDEQPIRIINPIDSKALKPSEPIETTNIIKTMPTTKKNKDNIIIQPTDRRPWYRQRILKKQDIPPQQEIYELALEFGDLQERSLFVLLYLTGARISEVVPCKYLSKVHYKKELVKDELGNNKLVVVRNDKGSPLADRVEKIEHNYKGIKKKDLILTQQKGKDILIISIENRKNKKTIRKRLAVPVEHEKHFIKLLYDYVDKLEDEQPLFPNLTVLKAEKIIKTVNLNPHFLRDIRLTHLILIYDFDAFRLQKFAGWSSVSPAERYVKLSVSDFVDKY